MTETCPNCQRLQERVFELEAEVVQLKTEISQLKLVIKELLARLDQNSGNSHRPPSSDPPGKKRKNLNKGGSSQPRTKGRPGKWRKSLPPEKVTDFHVLQSQECKGCGAALSNGKLLGVEQWQQIDLPPIQPIIREIHRLTIECPCCHTSNRAPNPFGRSAIGARLGSFIGMLRPKFHLSLQHTQDLLVLLLGEEARFSRSTLAAQERRVSVSLSQPYQEALQAAHNSKALWVDETGWREGGKMTWLWTATNADLTVFRIDPTRGKSGMEGLLGNYEGLLTTDRWCAYSSIPENKRQLCVTGHLIRDFQGLIDRDLGAKKTGLWAIQEINRIGTAWHSFRNGGMTGRAFRLALRPVRSRFRRLINQLLISNDKKARTLGKSLKKYWRSLWTFARYPEILELSNNRAERALRQPVTWRNVCQGSKSARGATFAHRAMTIIASLKQQGRNAWEFIASSLEAMETGSYAPRMVPGPAG